MLGLMLALLEPVSFESVLGKKIILFILAAVFPLMLILIHNIFLLSFGIRWVHYCI